MIEIANQVWAFLVKVGSDLGDVWRWATVCMLMSLAVTQWIKGEVAERIESHSSRRRVLQLIAFSAAFIPMAIKHPNSDGLTIAILLGVASPTLYKVVVYIIAMRWPVLCRVLSSDHPEHTLGDLIGKKDT